MRTHEPAAPWASPAARERCLREAQRYTRCPIEAEDVVQEALLRAWRSRAKLRNTAHPLPWLLQITRNEALRATRRRSREQTRSALVPDPEPAAPHDAGWDETAVTKLDVQSALRQLEPNERTLVNLRYSVELTHSGIADLMNMPVGTCKVRLHRLRKRLNALLAEEESA
jgi:RNA polymerase sigma-70 factor (ECF subfamily)